MLTSNNIYTVLYCGQIRVSSWSEQFNVLSLCVVLIVRQTLNIHRIQSIQNTS